jgi:L-rhamnose isomerase
MEELKTLPFPAVWDKLCLNAGVSAGVGWIDKVNQYEKAVLENRR